MRSLCTFFLSIARREVGRNRLETRPQKTDIKRDTNPRGYRVKQRFLASREEETRFSLSLSLSLSRYRFAPT